MEAERLRVRKDNSLLRKREPIPFTRESNYSTPVRPPDNDELPGEKKGLPWPVLLFLVTLVVPWILPIGPLRLSAYRIVLVVMVLPCLFMWLTGKVGRIRLTDIVVLSFCVWVFLSLIMVNGLSSSIEPSGIMFIETFGSYLLARCYIRGPDDFYNTVRALFLTNLFLFPFSLIEFVLGYNILHDMFSAILPTFNYPPMAARLGLSRVQSVFDHPILFGIFTGSTLALVHLVLGHGDNIARRFTRTAIVGTLAMMSLSGGPIQALAAQVFIIAWDSALKFLKSRWQIFLSLLALATIATEILAKRSLLEIMIATFTFDPLSYWFRRLIWSYGWASVLNHPFFGVGLERWERPDWMPPSIDNIWLYYAVHHGLPAAGLLLLAVAFAIWAACSAKALDSRLCAYRMGFIATLMAFFLTGWTVHYWGAAHCLFLFLMGSGAWMLERKANTGIELKTDTIKRIPSSHQRPSPHRNAFTRRILSETKLQISRKELPVLNPKGKVADLLP
ncbi:hypothetical protein G5V57_31375 [Nordella sp. HKS 07]|uniref:O-antigen ligase family protein n=1 Tax=Nordella sp. HKS 07 TaxID=2712222 RepID=UPI0013E19813|nr:hypothetical protein [Nordella sp. HKS 07]QIG51816.1 hypothetical protein G5V57_31375 [Nordella sp. HKS 07]